MARRRKEDDVAGIVAQIAGLAVLVSMVSPSVRNTLSDLGFYAILLLGLAFFGLAAFVIYQFATRSRGIPLPQAGGALARVAVSIPVAPTVPRDASPPPGAQALPGENGQVDLIDQLRNMDWFQFEKIVGLTYRKHGYSVTRRGGANPDSGIDLLIAKDGETKAVQCKHWKAWNVGVKAVREFLGALTDAGIQRGIFITLRGYTGEAKQLADKHGIEIVNEAGLAEMLAATDARFDPEVLEILGDTRKFCPKCKCEMVLRTAGRGAGTGRQFWGCSAYPRCRFTMPVAA